MKLFFVLGNHLGLSAAEIASVLRPETVFELPERQVLLAETPATDSEYLIKRLGGTIKIGSVLSFCPSRNPEVFKKELLKLVEDDLAKRSQTNKYCFGFSYYGANPPDLKKIGLTIKTALKEKNVSARFVVSNERTLSSVVVAQNKLLKGGAELVLIETPEGIFIGKTLAVQDFKGLSRRDYGRPGRDDLSGMLPPKLAQIMLNLSGKIPCHCDCAVAKKEKSPTVMDPFCGSGTILMEADMMGVEKIIGSDISAKALADTKINLEWLKKNGQVYKGNWQLIESSALEISKKVAPASVDAIVTEPYLGPQRGNHDLNQIGVELENLYSEALAEFKKILKPDGRVVIVFPAFAFGRRPDLRFISPDLNGWQIVETLPETLKNSLRTTARGTLIYGRPEQKVWREIVVLKLS